MKKTLAIIAVIFVILVIYSRKDTNKSSAITIHTNPNQLNINKIFPTLARVNSQPEQNSIFIPYWNIPKETNGLEEYDQLYYFGILATESGINESDEGYKNLSSFVDRSKDKERILVLRMLDTENNINILNNIENKQKIIKDVIAVAKENDFKGVALDLELSSLLLTDVTGQINDFVQQFYTQTKTVNLKFTVILYGDLFYRKRPFDLKTIGYNSDEIMIMAYDFHKSIGEPGPNFPLARRSDSEGGKSIQKYGYDFKQMINDYLQSVPKEKINVIFGMYGYDWTVDEKKKPIKPAKALSLIEIKKNFIDQCQWKDCLVTRDEISAETEVDYVVSNIVENVDLLAGRQVNMEYHIVWFEDEKSVDNKKAFLKEKGINKFGYWVYGYF